MKLPRNLSGAQLIKALDGLGYQATRQAGSHVRLTCFAHGEHYLTIPLHGPLRVGTLAAVLADVAAHERLDEPGFETFEGVRAARALPVWSELLGLVGKCDVDGIPSRWAHLSS